MRLGEAGEAYFEVDPVRGSRRHYYFYPFYHNSSLVSLTPNWPPLPAQEQRRCPGRRGRSGAGGGDDRGTHVAFSTHARTRQRPTDMPAFAACCVCVATGSDGRGVSRRGPARGSGGCRPRAGADNHRHHRRAPRTSRSRPARPIRICCGGCGGTGTSPASALFHLLIQPAMLLLTRSSVWLQPGTRWTWGWGLLPSRRQVSSPVASPSSSFSDLPKRSFLPLPPLLAPRHLVSPRPLILSFLCCSGELRRGGEPPP